MLLLLHQFREDMVYSSVVESRYFRAWLVLSYPISELLNELLVCQDNDSVIERQGCCYTPSASVHCIILLMLYV